MNSQITLILLGISSLLLVEASFKRKECTFPFKYNGKMYDDCVGDDASAPWCSATAEYNGMFYYCNDNEGEAYEKNGAFLQAQKKLMDNANVLNSKDFKTGDTCTNCEGEMKVIANSLKQIHRMGDDNERQINFLMDVENKNFRDALENNYKDIRSYINCPSDWYELNPNECFHFGRSRTISDADSYCRSKGGRHAAIHSDEENKVIAAKAKHVLGSAGSYSIGFTDESIEGRWIWKDRSDETYTHWNKGEPNNVGNENCLMVYMSTGYWNDVRCGIKIIPVCRSHILFAK